MDPISLTRALVDIESITGNEPAVGEFLLRELTKLQYATVKVPVEGSRFNIYAVPRKGPLNPKQLRIDTIRSSSRTDDKFAIRVTHVPSGTSATARGDRSQQASRAQVMALLQAKLNAPELVLSTHMDVVPPWFASSEDSENIYGRGACDAKGIIAAQIAAAERLRKDGARVGLLFLVGEERDSQGAKVANQLAQELHGGACKFLINGEPTENRMATASKGSLRVEVIAHGRLAHSAYPELGDSAIEKLLAALETLRALPLPHNPDVGPCTMNIGVIEGGRAPNVIADRARAQLLYRLVGPADELRKQIVAAVGDLAQVEAQFTLEIPFMQLQTIAGIPTMVAAFTTDIPALTNWGRPVLLGPGSIHVAHTEREFIGKKDLHAAIDLYSSISKELLKS